MPATRTRPADTDTETNPDTVPGPRARRKKKPVEPEELPALPLNRVDLAGRFPVEAEARVLPSGAELVTFRVVVGRDPEAPGGRPEPENGRKPPTVDTIDCVVWDDALREAVLAVPAGSWVQVSGALRRRFYRGPGGLGSRYEVEVEQLTATAPLVEEPAETEISADAG